MTTTTLPAPPITRETDPDPWTALDAGFRPIPAWMRDPEIPDYTILYDALDALPAPEPPVDPIPDKQALYECLEDVLIDIGGIVVGIEDGDWARTARGALDARSRLRLIMGGL